MNNPIYLTKTDYERLRTLIETERRTNGPHDLEALGQEMKRALVVEPAAVPPDVVTMNSVVRLRDVNGAAPLEITVVYPRDANVAQRKISVLAPVATAVLGCRVGDQIAWAVPKGTVTYQVEAIVYQPEAAGDWNL
ncbi:nucleoside diphosphate kinase regulator [Hymenobacter sp. B81]|uniref:nucleoside diphosphate kinase regulator n=1 Tax=Hymenobacter sp. B81 TaxID=3344878 RepID=UPI0037DD3841